MSNVWCLLSNIWSLTSVKRKAPGIRSFSLLLNYWLILQFSPGCGCTWRTMSSGPEHRFQSRWHAEDSDGMPGSSRAVKNFGRDRKLSLCRILHILPFLLNSFRIFGQHCFSCKYISLEFAGFPTNKKLFYHSFLIFRGFPEISL